MPVNKEAGEVEIILGGIEYIMRPTWEALTRIESGTGKTIVKLMRSLIDADLLMADIAVILSQSITATGQNMKVAEAGRLILKEGLGSGTIVAAIGHFLTNALTGGAEPGEAKATEAEANPSPTVATSGTA